MTEHEAVLEHSHRVFHLIVEYGMTREDAHRYLDLIFDAADETFMDQTDLRFLSSISAKGAEK